MAWYIHNARALISAALPRTGEEGVQLLGWNMVKKILPHGIPLISIKMVDTSDDDDDYDDEHSVKYSLSFSLLYYQGHASHRCWIQLQGCPPHHGPRP